MPNAHQARVGDWARPPLDDEPASNRGREPRLMTTAHQARLRPRAGTASPGRRWPSASLALPELVRPPWQPRSDQPKGADAGNVQRGDSFPAVFLDRPNVEAE